MYVLFQLTRSNQLLCGMILQIQPNCRLVVPSGNAHPRLKGTFMNSMSQDHVSLPWHGVLLLCYSFMSSCSYHLISPSYPCYVPIYTYLIKHIPKRYTKRDLHVTANQNSSRMRASSTSTSTQISWPSCPRTKITATEALAVSVVKIGERRWGILFVRRL